MDCFFSRIRFILLFLATFPLLSHAAEYSYSANSKVIGQVQLATVNKGENLLAIAKKYDIASSKIIDANPQYKNKILHPGDVVIVPTRFILPKYREGIVVNLAELRLYYFPLDSNKVYTYPIAVGRIGWRTPTTKTLVYKKEANPIWKFPTCIRNYTYQTKGYWLPSVVMPGPDNPLGKYALYLKLSGYLIHGTNDPSSIGKYVSSGCMRMYAPDIEQLYNLVPIGTSVYIIHHAYKADWHHKELYLESHKLMDEMANKTDLNHTTAEQAINDVADKDNA